MLHTNQPPALGWNSCQLFPNCGNFRAVARDGHAQRPEGRGMRRVSTRLQLALTSQHGLEASILTWAGPQQACDFGGGVDHRGGGADPDACQQLLICIQAAAVSRGDAGSVSFVMGARNRPPAPG